MPSTIVKTPLLDRNLAALGGRNQALVERLRATKPHPGVRFEPTDQGVPAVTLDGRPLCSRHRPLDEATQLAARHDPIDAGVFVVIGFGAGYHVRRLAERMKRSGLILVYEPDIMVLRAVFEQVDHSAWLDEAVVGIVTDPDDRGAITAQIRDGESIVAQGAAYIEHPASRQRLGEGAARFVESFTDVVGAAKVTLLTTLMRSIDTVRNFLFNIDHYAAGPGVLDLAGAARGYPAVIVSAGPSLSRNIERLARPGVRERCVIVAAQTTLRPLLDAGIRPHFVTALDFHEISRRFYTGLTLDEVAQTTLIVDPKANPVILDGYPGPLRCCASYFLDDLLGKDRRDMGRLPAGATVAHLAVYVARHLGCDPVILLGQDLAFTDGLYYTPGTAISEVWAPELGPFNTIEMMEWQRIVRHRAHLRKLTDVHGRSIFTDQQMVTYLQQFERDFGDFERRGITVIDATEGGLPKQHTTTMSLDEALERFATRPLPQLPLTPSGLDPDRLAATKQRLGTVRGELSELQDTAREAQETVRAMLDDQDDDVKMEAHFQRIEQQRRVVEERFEAFTILRYLNQLGEFKRFGADRRLHLEPDLDPKVRQRRQLERDLVSVTWISDAASEMDRLLEHAETIVSREGEPPSKAALRRSVTPLIQGHDLSTPLPVGALLAVDPETSGLGVRRSLANYPGGGGSLLQATLERLGDARELAVIVLVVPEDLDVEALIDRSRIKLSVELERCVGSPFGFERPAVAAARRLAEQSWRGGLAGMTLFDEVLCPGPMLLAMERRDLAAGVVVGADWPLVDPADGCDALVRRFRELPEQHNIVFTQAPPGLSGCLVSRELMEEFVEPHRFATIGARLSYQPRLPQHDPIARSLNVTIDEHLSRARVRVTCDSARQRRRLAMIIEATGTQTPTMKEVVDACEHILPTTPEPLPQHVILELTPRRAEPRGLLFEGPTPDRPPLSKPLLEKILASLATIDDVVLTLGGSGDPLWHDDFDTFIVMSREAGVGCVHLRSELRAERAIIERLETVRPDVISVDLHADTPETYRRTMGDDGFHAVIDTIEAIVESRPAAQGVAGTPAGRAPLSLALPWVVPRLRRCLATYEDQETFFDRWLLYLGTAVIDGPLLWPGAPLREDPLIRTLTPPRVMRDLMRHTMMIRSDGHVLRLDEDRSVGSLAEESFETLWLRAAEPPAS